MPEILKAPLTVEFPFTRSLGPVQSAFLTGLRDRVLLGARAANGRVLVPPAEYDPESAEEIRDLVEVAPTGTVTTWAWNPDPRRGQPLATPFAWVLVRLDGADTGLLHALDAPGPEAVRTGLRVRVRWAVERRGAITDIACFVPHDGPPAPTTGHSGVFADPVTGILAPARLDYTYTPGRALGAHLAALAERRVVGERCPSCRKVYVPPRGACPTCGIATAEQVDVGPRGTVTTFCVVNIKATHTANSDIEVPYVYAHIALDGADLPLHGRVGGVPHDRVRMGMRVEPVWTPGSLHPDHYRPTGEPDADHDPHRDRR
ncbi:MULTISPECIES: Zn-ribbon domain-containing OB-fold protein [unclassified Streptomyces]|uniref:Zn-ribbon domain-containing OB-fold protein n=1 Tax=unclassified Streptomyces TaxID=2593676 RepID=UPI0019071383|nr:OB-fold domain-containing protein [Streptomyces sp. HSG2]